MDRTAPVVSDVKVAVRYDGEGPGQRDIGSVGGGGVVSDGRGESRDVLHLSVR